MTHVPYAIPALPVVPDRRPGAVTAFYVYCALMVLLYLAVAIGGAVFFVFAAEIAADDPQTTVEETQILGGLMGVMGVIFAAVFAIPPFLPRRMWAWIVGIIAIALGLTSCCLWPLCIPLMIFYVQQPARLWYGVGVNRDLPPATGWNAPPPTHWPPPPPHSPPPPQGGPWTGDSA